MPVSFARWSVPSPIPVRAGYCCAFVVVSVLLGSRTLQTADANGDTRTISFHHIHTNEDLTITYKVNGRYDEEALKKINHELRDWRKNETIKMDPHLIDLVWDVYREVEAKGPIWVVCGYRSPGTNAMLRKRSRGVAQHSQHMLGKAMDFYIPGVPLANLREAGLRAQRGGVGYYPTSGSPFVHLDTGSVRHWPHMPDALLAKVLAKGPLTQVAAKEQPTRVAAASGGFMDSFTNLLGRIRGDVSGQQAPAADAAAEESIQTPAETLIAAAAVPLPQARPTAAEARPTPAPAETFELASAESKPAPERPSLISNLFSEHGLWQAMPQFRSTEAATARIEPPADIGAPATAAEPERQTSPIAVAVIEPETTSSLTPWPSEEPKQVVASAGGLAYAPTVDEEPRKRAAPMGKLTSRPRTPQPDTTVAIKRSGNRPSVVSSGPASSSLKRPERLNDPWMRAMIVSPSAMSFMSTSFMGLPDYRALGPYLHKPHSSVMMTFSQDPYLGLSVNTFSGSAVVFVSTVTYSVHTAALQ